MSKTGWYEWHTLGFMAAPAGWHLVYLDDAGEISTRPMPGWLIQEEVAHDRWQPSLEYGQLARPVRRVVAAAETRGFIEVAAGSDDTFWCVIGPGGWSTAAEIAEEFKRRSLSKGQIQ